MASVSLIIVGESLNPAKVTRLLELKPSQQWKKGELKSSQRADGSVHFFDSKHKQGGWKLWPSEKQRKNELRKQIECWLAILTPKKEALAKAVAPGYEAFLDCCIIGEADSVSLSPETLLRLSQLGLTFEVTFYSSSEEEPKALHRMAASPPRRVIRKSRKGHHR